MKSNVLVLGDGLLGSEIIKQTGWNYISRKKDKFDFIDITTYWKIVRQYDPNIILNCIGYTNTYSEEKQKHWNVNVEGIVGLSNYCEDENIKLVHISTDYLYAGSVERAKETDVPVINRNWYSYTKLVADGIIQTMLENFYLIIRTSFKPYPFPYDMAITNQVGNFDYVNKIAELIIQVVGKGANGIYNIGTNTKNIYELAIKTKPNIIGMYKFLHPSMPENITMNLNKMNLLLGTNYV